MSQPYKNELFKRVAPRYQKASKEEKSRILDEFSANGGYNRKYATFKLSNFKPSHRPPKPKSKPGPKSKYNLPEVINPLEKIWLTANLPCSKRLKALLPIWLKPYQLKFGFLPFDILKKIASISPATIDRILKPTRIQHTGKGRSTTKPGLLLKSQIPIKTNQWDEFRPGFLEGDTVAHCGTSMAGDFAFTIDTVDIATGWTEQRAVYNKGEIGVQKQIQNIENSLPFPLLGFDSDQGSEFINWHLWRYFHNRKTSIQFTSSRPYKKNDNAHIEQKNWTHVRQWLGYRRFEDPDIVPLLNDLYKNEWRLFLNFFLPSVKLLDKQRIRSRIVKKHDLPKTPYQRVLESPYVLEQTKQSLKDLFQTLNPFDLRDAIDRKIKTILSLAK